MDPTHGVGADRSQASRVVVGEELGLVRGDVDIDRAVAFASLARHAEIERVLHRFIAPGRRNVFAGEHLEEQTRAAPRGMLFLARGHEARAHRACFHAPALADAHAAQDSSIDAPFVFRKMKVRLR